MLDKQAQREWAQGKGVFAVAQGRQLETALIVDDHPLFCDALSMTLRSR